MARETLMKMAHESDLDLSDLIKFEFAAALSLDFAGVEIGRASCRERV